MTAAVAPPLMSCLRAAQRPVGAVLCVHPGGLPGRHYAALADALPDWSIYLVEIGLSRHYWQDRQSPETAMAALLEEIRTTALSGLPNAPLILCGWSFGGAVAQALARDWPRQGRIALLAMFDTLAPVPGSDFASIVRRRSVSARWFVQSLNAQKQVALRLPWWRRLADEPVLLERLLQQAIERKAMAAGTTLPGFRKVYTTFVDGLLRNTRLAYALGISPYAGRTLLVRARSGLLRRFRILQHMGWQGYATPLVVRSIDADHYTLLADADRMRQVGSLIAAEARMPASDAASVPFDAKERP